MGREVRRVPLDFDHPIGELWPGFVPPSWRACPAGCHAGATPADDWLEGFVSLLLLAGGDSARDRQHPFIDELHSAMGYDGRVPCGLAELTTALAGRAPSGWGHDAIDRWTATKKLIQAAGLPEDWGTCKTCNGHGIHPDDLAASEAWAKTDPPNGPGWQMWETTSEGSPMSPVFATPEKLAWWLSENGVSACGNMTATYEAWLGMIRQGSAVDMVSDGHSVMSGVSFEARGDAP